MTTAAGEGAIFNDEIHRAMKAALVTALRRAPQPLTGPGWWDRPAFDRHPAVAARARVLAERMHRRAGSLPDLLRLLGCRLRLVWQADLARVRRLIGRSGYVRGMFLPRSRLVYVDRSLNAAARQWVIAHECGHAVHFAERWDLPDWETGEVAASAFAYAFLGLARAATSTSSPAQRAARRGRAQRVCRRAGGRTHLVEPSDGDRGSRRPRARVVR